MKRMCSVFCLLCLFVSATAIAAEEKLTNSSVIEMHKLGLGDGVLVEKIKNSTCAFDVSLDALKQLKDAGISDTVIQAMISAGAPKPTASDTTPAPPGDPNDPAAVHEAGVYWYSESNGQKKMTLIEPSVVSGTKGGFAFFAAYGQQASRKAVVDNLHAEVQMNTRRPVFYFYFEKTQAGLSQISRDAATGPQDFTLVKMEIKESKNERRFVIGKSGAFGSSSSGASKKAIQALGHEKISPGVYKITPNEDLPDGEYCFIYTGTTPLVGLNFAAGGGGKVFCFGVQSAEPYAKSRK